MAFAVHRIYKLVSLLCISLMACSCAILTGSHKFMDVELPLPPNTVVRDVRTKALLEVDTVFNDSITQYTLTLRNGEHHVISCESDSGNAYIRYDLHRNAGGFLNYFNYGLGCIIDQAYECNYFFYPETIKSLHFTKRTPEQRWITEDSLLSLPRYPFPSSLINRRMNFVFTVWGTMGINGPQAYDIGFFNIFEWGIGLAPVPYVMPFYVRSTNTISEYADGYANDHRIYAATNQELIGIAFQEPRFGVFGAWRYGVGVVDVTEKDADVPEFSLLKSNITSYALSVGIYGQWGRLEYRYSRVTSFSQPITQIEYPVIMNNVFWTVHFML